MILFVTEEKKKQTIDYRGKIYLILLGLLFYLLLEDILKCRELIYICKGTPMLENTSIFLNLLLP